MPEVSRVVLPNPDGDVLMVQEAKRSARGLWTFPGGTVQPDESAQAAALRETAEEVGYRVELIDDKPIDEAELPGGWHYRAFLGRITGGRLMIDRTELLDARWLSTEVITRLNAGNQLRDSLLVGTLEKAAGRFVHQGPQKR